MATAPQSAINGMRILMVEDEMMLAMSLEDLLKLLGCEVVKAARVAKAVKLAETESVDGALLDVNLAGERVYPVAAELDRRGIPFVFMTGYDVDRLDSGYHGRPALQKPFQMDDMVRVMADAFARQ
ncbi:MAG TPA: response regulator [Gammaproteobacteria bacterium]|jgi:DNA-binding response OmpR family regulator|nr:response regulator [Gammaproteobacteria bacterium]